MVNRFRGNSNHWKHNIQQYPIVLFKTPSYNINMHLIVPESITLTVIIIECSFSLNIKETGKKQFTFSFCFLFIEIVSMFWNLYLYYVTTHVCYHRSVLKHESLRLLNGFDSVWQMFKIRNMAVYHRLPLAAAQTESQSVHDTINKQHNIHM